VTAELMMHCSFK